MRHIVAWTDEEMIWLQAYIAAYLAKAKLPDRPKRWSGQSAQARAKATELRDK